MSAAFTPGPWKWQGEDYRAGWGWQILVGPNGEGLIVGQDKDGAACKHLRAYTPVDSSLCITGRETDDKPHVEPVHVFSEANAHLIAAAPDLAVALDRMLRTLDGDFAMEAIYSNGAVSDAHAALRKARGEQL